MSSGLHGGAPLCNELSQHLVDKAVNNRINVLVTYHYFVEWNCCGTPGLLGKKEKHLDSTRNSAASTPGIPYGGELWRGKILKNQLNISVGEIKFYYLAKVVMTCAHMFN